MKRSRVYAAVLLCFNVVLFVGIVVYAARSGVLKPETVSAGEHFYNGLVPFSKGFYEHAIPRFTKALQVDPNFTGAYDLRGQSYMEIGQYDLAAKDFDSALRLSPNDEEIQARRAAAVEALQKR